MQKNRYPNKCAVALLRQTRNKGTGLYDPFVFDTTAIISNQSAINHQSISNQMIFLRIAVRLLTIAVHKEMILETLILCFKQQMLVFTQQ